MRLKQKELQNIEGFITDNGRDLDVALYNYHFKGGSTEAVITELIKYQNPDGGFGKGIEPDIQSSNSSPISTTYALQYLSYLNDVGNIEFVQKTLEYFTSTYSKDVMGWPPTLGNIDDVPHAPWWTYDQVKYESDDAWGNPTIEIIGYYIQYSESIPGFIHELLEKALNRLETRDNIEGHELKCYVRLFEILEGKTLDANYQGLLSQIKKVIELDETKWDGYVMRPLDFINSPNSFLYKDLKESVNKELDYIITNRSPDGVWEPAWSWGMYEDTWIKVKPGLTAHITVRNLITLNNLDRIDL